VRENEILLRNCAVKKP